MMRWNREAAMLGIPDLPEEGFKHVGDRKIKPQGGGSGGGSQTSTSYTSSVPKWLESEQKDLVARGFALGQQDYQPYTGERISQFTPLQRTAFGQAERQQVAPQIGEATGLAGLAARQGLQAGQFQTGQFTPMGVQGPQLQQFQLGAPMGVGTQSFTQPGMAQQFMDPYMQNVVNIQQQAAQRQADIQATQRGAQAVRAGAFGGSRQAIENAEANRALASQMGEIQARGLQDAFGRAQEQFGREQQLGLQAQMANQQAGLTAGQANLQSLLGVQQLGAQTGMQAQLANQQALADAQRAFEQSRQFGADLGLRGGAQALQGAQTLGQLGQQRFGQEMDIMGRQRDFGAQQQQQIQRILDQQFADFQAQRDFPYQQLGFMSDLIQGRGGSTRQMYTVPQPSTAQTLAGLGTAAAGIAGMAKGGEVGYADGGIMSLMGDDQLRQVQSPMDQMAAQEEMMRRQAIRDQAPASMPREADMTEAELLHAMQRAMQEGDRAKAAVIREIIEDRRIEDSGIAMIAPETAGDIPDGGLAEMAGGGMVSFREGTDEEGIRIPYTPRKTSGQRALDDFLYATEQGLGGEYAPLSAARTVTMGTLGTLTDAAGNVIDTVADTKALPMSSGYLAQRDRDEAARAARRQAAAEREAVQKRTIVPSKEVAVAPAAGIATLAPAGGITPSAARDAKLLQRQDPMSGGVVQALAMKQQEEAQTRANAGNVATAGAGGAGPTATSRGVLNMLKAAGYDIDKMNADEIAAATRAQEARRAGIAQNRADLEQMIAARGVYGQEQEGRIKSEIEGFTGKKEDAKSMALFQAGLAILSADPSRGAFAAIGEGALKGVTAYKGDIEKLDEKKSKLNERLDRIADIRRQERFADDKDLLALKKEENMLTAEAEREAQEILRGHNIRRADVAKFAVQEDLKARAAAERKRDLASMSLAERRLELQALNRRSINAQNALKAAQTALDDEGIAKAKADIAAIDAEIRALTSRDGGGGSQPVGGGGKVATSAQLPAGFQLD